MPCAGKGGFTSKSGFSACDHLFSAGCSGEVANLILVAERYGVLIEQARARIETICRQCRNYSRSVKNRTGKKESGHENRVL